MSQLKGNKNHLGVAILLEELQTLANDEVARHSQRFFKTGEGQYAAGDQFLGIRVPTLRRLSRAYKGLGLAEIVQLLCSPIHEIRLLALLLLILQYQKGNATTKLEIVGVYLAHIGYVNNWDLIDTSAPKILGDYLYDKDKSVLYQLVQSENLWERRIAIIATHTFIRNASYSDTLLLIEILMNDKQNLIQKACGWMLREVGKRDLETEITFLDRYAKIMPRTMLRYALELLPEWQRKQYMSR